MAKKGSALELHAKRELRIAAELSAQHEALRRGAGQRAYRWRVALATAVLAGLASFGAWAFALRHLPMLIIVIVCTALAVRPVQRLCDQRSSDL